jgi:curli biogenesis system outer membrane secretion channel CsgG
MMRRILAAGLVVGMLAGPAWADDATAPAPSEEGGFYTPEFGVRGKVRELTGPKRVLAVGEFNSTGAFETYYGDWDSGGGVEAIMINALAESGQFVVVDRSALKQILTEQELAANNLTAGDSGVEAGKLIGANLYVIGSITQVDLDSKGSGFSIGFSGGPLGRKNSVGLSPQFRSGKLVMDVRVVDAKTAQIIQSFTVKQKVKDKSIGVVGSYDFVSFGNTNFWKTPLGEAMRELVAKAVTKIVDSGEDVEWAAQVVEYEAPTIYINAGADNGLATGDEFVVKRTTKQFTDPSTGQVLGTRESELGLITIHNVEARLAEGTFSSWSQTAPRRGDRVALVTR